MRKYDVPSKRASWWATGISVTPIPWMREFRHIMKRFERINGLEGDVIECGVGEGQTFSMLAYLVGSESRDPMRVLWGFDSFQGWPEPSEYDKSPRDPKKGEWKVSQRVIKKRLKDSKVYESFPGIDIRIVRGFLRNSLKRFPEDRNIAFLHIDVDLYEGYRDSLEYLFPKVVTGGVVCFDEYREFPARKPYYGKTAKWPGCDKAVDEYLARIPGQFELNHDIEAKKYFVVKR